MPSNRFWHSSQYSHTLLLVEEGVITYSDGMPTTEASLLATVCPGKQGYDIRIYGPDARLIREFSSTEHAQRAVCMILNIPPVINGKSELL